MNTSSVQLPLKRANATNAGGDLVTDFSIDSTADMTLNTLTLNGNLFVAGFYSAKPYVSLRVTTTGGTATTINISNQPVMGTTETTSLASFGYNSTVSVVRGTARATNAFIYTFSWTGARPLAPSWVQLYGWCSISNRCDVFNVSYLNNNNKRNKFD